MTSSRRFLYCLSLTTSLLLASTLAHAGAIEDCANLAAHPGDAKAPGKSVLFSAMDGERAKIACQNAYESFPNDGFVNVSLSRAYNKLGEYESSFKHASIALQSDYPFALYWMGIHHSYGDGIPKDETEANRWYRKASDQGVAIGSKALATNLRQGKGAQTDLPQALSWAEKAIEQGSKQAWHEKGLILEAQASELEGVEDQKDRYVGLLRRAFDAIYKASGFGNSRDEVLARINKKIEAAQPVWEDVIPSSLASNTSTPQGNKWRSPAGQLQKDGIVYRAAFTNVGESVFTLWHAYSKTVGASQWFIDFGYRGKSEIGSIDDITAYYTGELSHGFVDNWEEIGFSELATKPLPGGLGYRAVGKVDFRSVELLRAGSKLKISFWNSDHEYMSFSFALNDDEYGAESRSIVTAMVDTARKLDGDCCAASNITPFSMRYWNEKESCHNLSLFTEEEADRIYWAADPHMSAEGRTRAKKEKLAICKDLSLPVTFRKKKILYLETSQR